jgi:pimeloyl-ACP methyl ester carboxylesterase
MSNTPIYRETSGQGTPPLVFIHGWCGDSTDWRYQRAIFAPSNEMVACDLRGHGRSRDIVEGLDIPTCGGDVADILATPGLSQAVLVGHGLGCRVALEAARLRPDALTGVVLIDGDRHVAGDPDLAVEESRERYADTGFGAFRDALVESMFLDAGESKHKAEVIARARRVPEAIAEAYWHSILRWDATAVEGALRDLQVPLLVLQSTYLTADYRHFAADPRMMTPWLEVIGRLVPSVRIQIIGGAGHFPMLDAPDAVGRCIATFLADATFRRFFEFAD